MLFFHFPFTIHTIAIIECLYQIKRIFNTCHTPCLPRLTKLVVKFGCVIINSSREDENLEVNNSIYNSSLSVLDTEGEKNVHYDNPVYEGMETAISEYEVARETTRSTSFLDSVKFDNQIYASVN